MLPEIPRRRAMKGVSDIIVALFELECEEMDLVLVRGRIG